MNIKTAIGYVKEMQSTEKRHVECANTQNIEYFKEKVQALVMAEEALQKQLPYKLKSSDGETGICKCGVVTEAIDNPFYCKYCGQRLCK